MEIDWRIVEEVEKVLSKAERTVSDKVLKGEVVRLLTKIQTTLDSLNSWDSK